MSLPVAPLGIVAGIGTTLAFVALMIALWFRRDRTKR
jgi:hypothetical protein